MPEETPDQSSDSLEAGLRAGYGGARRGSVIECLEDRTGSVLKLNLPDTGDEREPVVKPGGLAASTRFGTRYQVLGEIAHGGLGIVLKGRDLDLGRDVAIKVLHERFTYDRQVIERFVEEAQIGGQLQHPGIVPVYELGLQSDDRPFFAMKLVKGETLASMLKKRREPSEDLAHFLRVFLHVCHTVAYAHARSVVHRDLKPANVLVGAFGEVQVIDWGLAKVLRRGGVADEQQSQVSRVIETIRSQPGSDSTTSRAGSVMGTPAYMPPEQARGLVDELDERSDVFALGAILCEILTGSPPYTGDKKQVFQDAFEARLDDARARLDACAADRQIVDLAQRCLARAPRERPSGAEVVAAEVAGHLSSVEERARAAQISAAEARGKAEEEQRARRMTLALSGLVILALLVGGGAWLELQRERDERTSETRRGVDAALAAATVHQGAAEWSEAQSAIERALALLAAGAPDPDLARETRELATTIDAGAEEARRRAELETENRELLARLDEIRVPEHTHPEYPHDWREVVHDYQRAFAAAGLELEALPPEEAGRALRERGIPVELAGALDKWMSAYQRFATEEEPILRLFEVARAADPDPVRTQLRSAILAQDQGALRKLSGEEHLRGYSPTTLDLLADALAESGAVDEAVAVYRTAQRLHPGDWLLNLGLAASLLKLEPPQPEESVRFYTAAAVLRPGHLEARHGLANTLEERLGRTAEALELYREMLVLQPDDAHLRWHLGRALLALGKFEAAIEAHRAAVLLDPDAVDAWTGLASALQQTGQYEEAIAPLEAAIWLDPKNIDIYVNLGGALLSTGDLEGALAVNAEARRVRPESYMPHNNLGNILRLLGDDTKALDAYRAALPLVPDEFRYLVLCNLATLLFRKGESSTAIAYYREALSRRPEHPPILNGLAWALAQAPEGQREPEEAVTLARRATELAPDQTRGWTTLGLACYRAARWKDCLAAIERSLASRANHQDVLCLLLTAMARQQLGEHAVARECFAQAVRKIETGERAVPERQPVRDGVVWITLTRSFDEDEELARLRAEAAALLGLDDE